MIGYDYLDKIKEALGSSREELYNAFLWHKELAKSYFDSSFPEYNARSQIVILRYPYVHYEITAYQRPMGDRVDVYESTTGTHWYKIN